MTETADRFSALSRLARRLAPAGTGMVCFEPQGQTATLFPQEEREMSRAVPARRREFAAGRTAARAALAQLGIAPAAIPVGTGRAPIWPSGMVGSIAHCALGGITIVAHDRAVASLGVDLECDTPLAPDLWPHVLTQAERRELAHLPAAERGRDALDRFVAKEALFKAQYPLTGAMLDFDAVTVHVRPPDVIVARVCRPFGPYVHGDQLKGRLDRAGGMVLAVVALFKGADARLHRAGDMTETECFRQN